MRTLFWGSLLVLTGTVVWIVLVHIQIWPIGVLFYRAVGLLVFCTVLVALGMFLVKKNNIARVDYKDIFITGLIFFTFNLMFFTLVVLTLERSVSVFLLGYLDEQTQPLNKEEITRVFVDTYVYKYDAMGKRFNEQIVSGNVQKTGDKYIITNQGRLMVRVFGIIADVFGTGRKFISP